MVREVVSGSLFLHCLRTFFYAKGKAAAWVNYLDERKGEGYTEVTSRKTPRTLLVTRRGNGITLITW